VRYQPGKDDWLVARLPAEGSEAGVQRAADVARRDVPTCLLREPVDEVARRVREEGWALAVVVNEERVVLGRLRPSALEERPDAVAEELLVPGPRTIRGTRPASEMGAWLDERKIPGVLVTSADGVLVGYVRREDV
jgi:CBS domain-containing protein